MIIQDMWTFDVSNQILLFSFISIRFRAWNVSHIQFSCVKWGLTDTDLEIFCACTEGLRVNSLSANNFIFVTIQEPRAVRLTREINQSELEIKKYQLSRKDKNLNKCCSSRRKLFTFVTTNKFEHCCKPLLSVLRCFRYCCVENKKNIYTDP